jgi:hypothetical protein
MIGTPTALFIGSGASSSGDDDYVVTLTGGAPVGQRVWVFHCADGGVATPTVPTITTLDSKGNTWTTFRAGMRNGVTGGTVVIYASTTVPTTALVAGDTVTIRSLDWGASRRATAIFTASGVDTLDQQAAADPGSTSALSIGPTAATDTAEEICWAFWGSGIRTFTATGGYTEVAETGTSVGTSDRQVMVAYRIVTSTGTQTATGTLSASTTVVGALSTWRAAASESDQAHYIYNGTDWVPAAITLL